VEKSKEMLELKLAGFRGLRENGALVPDEVTRETQEQLDEAQTESED